MSSGPPPRREDADWLTGAAQAPRSAGSPHSPGTPYPHGASHSAGAPGSAGGPPPTAGAPPTTGAPPLTALEALRRRAAAPVTASPAAAPPAVLLPAEPPAPRPLRAAGYAVSGMFLADRLVRPVVESATRAQRPLTTGRRVVVVRAHPRSGATTTAVAMALLLSRIRRERIAFLSAGGDPGVVAARTACPPRLPAELVLREIESGRAADAATVASLMDQIAPNAWSVSVQQDPASQAVARLARTFSRFFGVSVVDAAEPSGLLGNANALVLTGDGSHEGMRAVEVAFTNLMSTGLVDPRRLIVCLVRTQQSSRIDLRWEAGLVRRQGVRSVGIPWDPHLAAGRQIRSDFLGSATHRALTHLLAESIDTSMAAEGGAA